MSIINIRRDVNSHCESRTQRCHAIPCHPMPYHTVYCYSLARWFVYLFLSRWINIFIVVIGQTYNYFYQMLFTFPFDFHENCCCNCWYNGCCWKHFVMCWFNHDECRTAQSVAEQRFFFLPPTTDLTWAENNAKNYYRNWTKWKICQSADSFVYLVS